MAYRPDKHRRRSIRLKGYDYAQAGAYCVTVCCRHRQCLFGEVIGGVMHPNEAGRTVGAVWQQLPSRFPQVSTDAFVVMPNHVHGIITVGAPLAAPLTADAPPETFPIVPPLLDLGLRSSPSDARTSMAMRGDRLSPSL